MGRRRGLIDSNVLIAGLSLEHKHHGPSATFFERMETSEYTTALHCLSEFFSGATRPKSQGGIAWPSKLAALAVERLIRECEILDLSMAQHIAALESFAEAGGVGPNVYDFLIGRVAIVHAIPLIVTWNVKHLAPLFPTLRVATPAELLQET